MDICPNCGTMNYNLEPDDAGNLSCRSCNKKFKQQEEVVVTLSIIKGTDTARELTVTVKLNDRNKTLENAGVMGALINEFHELLRKRFSAHQLQIEPFAAVVTKKKRTGARRRLSK